MTVSKQHVFNSMSSVKPIFILGMNGSGTHMLADSLNNHPMIYIHKHEIRSIPFYCLNIAKFGDLQNSNNFKKLLDSFCDNPGFRLSNNNLPVVIPYTFENLNEKSLPKVIDLTFSYFALKEKKKIWGEHSPKYATAIPQLLDLFPRAKIIHIIRDGRDCAQSLKRRFRKNIFRTIFQWKKLVEKARKDGCIAGSDRYFEVKYEDLTDDPEHFMKSICSFLEVPFHREVLVSNMPAYNTQESGGPCQQRKAIVRNSFKWRKCFTNAEIEKLEGIAGTSLSDIGYKIMFTPGDKDLKGVHLFMLKSVDRIRMTFFAYKRYRDKDKTANLVSVVKRSLKQNEYFKY